MLTARAARTHGIDANVFRANFDVDFFGFRQTATVAAEV